DRFGARQYLRPPVDASTFRNLRYRFDFASGREDALEACTRGIDTEHNVVIIAPRSSPVIRRVAQGHGGASRNGNLFQLGRREECDPSAVWREKRIRGVFGSGERCRLQLSATADIELPRSSLVSNERESASSWRQNQGCTRGYRQ